MAPLISTLEALGKYPCSHTYVSALTTLNGLSSFTTLRLRLLALADAIHLMNLTGKAGRVGASMSQEEHKSWRYGYAHHSAAPLPRQATAQWLLFELTHGPKSKIFMPLHLKMAARPKGLLAYAHNTQMTFMPLMCATQTVTKLQSYAEVLLMPKKCSLQTASNNWSSRSLRSLGRPKAALLAAP